VTRKGSSEVPSIDGVVRGQKQRFTFQAFPPSKEGRGARGGGKSLWVSGGKGPEHIRKRMAELIVRKGGNYGEKGERITKRCVGGWDVLTGRHM